MDYLGFCVRYGFKFYKWLMEDAAINFTVQAVMKATNLKNSQDQEPEYKTKSKLCNGWSLVYILPPGIAIKEFEDRRRFFEAYTNSLCEFELSGRRLVMNVYKSGFPDKVPFAFERPEKMLAPIPIGVTPEGVVIYVDLANLPHMLVGGMTGYGKTTALIVFVTSLLLAGVEVSVIDRKRVDFPQFSPWVDLALKESDTESLLEKTVKEMDSRMDKLQAAGVQKIQNYKGDMKYKVIIIDELTVIESKKSHKYIDELVHLGRAAGISLILATQRPSAKVWDGFTEARAMLGGRLCFYVSDSTDSQIVLGKGNSKGAELPQKPGIAIWNNDRDQMVKAMYLDADKAVELLNKQVGRRKKDESKTIRIPARQESIGVHRITGSIEHESD